MPGLERGGPQADADSAWAALAHVVAGGGARSGRVRVSRDGGRSYPSSRERALTGALPNQPAAVRVYDDDGYARCLSVDLDVSRGGQQQVDRDVARLLELLHRCGGRAFMDRSPGGGRHVYLPLVTPVHYTVLRPVALALGVLLPSVDPMPTINLRAGCLRPPGARHKTGGWQSLDGPLAAAVSIGRNPNPPAVWRALTDALAPQLDALEPAHTDLSLALPVEGGGAGREERRAHQAHLPRSPGRLPALNPGAHAIATSGTYDTARYATPSQARQAVHASAAARGWHFADLLVQIEAGRWPGLWQLYARYGAHQQRPALARDWLAAVSYARRHPLTPSPESVPLPSSAVIPEQAPRPTGDQGQSYVHNATTREPTTHRGGLRVDTNSALSIPRDCLEELTGHQHVRAWWTAVRLAERIRYPGRGGHSIRLVLRALANAGQKTGRTHLAFGVRAYAIACGMAHSTVVQALQQLREEPDPLIVRVVQGRGLLGDLYELRIPEEHLEQAWTQPWRTGNIQALLPAFRVLGVPSAFIYEQLDNTGQSSWDLADAAHLSYRAAQAALAELAAHNLAQRDAHGWTRGAADPQAVARSLGALDQVDAQIQRYRRDREQWRERLGLTYPTDHLNEATDPGQPPRAPEAQPPGWSPLLPQPPPSHNDAHEDALKRALAVLLTILGPVVRLR